jgi:hypothetical protein
VIARHNRCRWHANEVHRLFCARSKLAVLRPDGAARQDRRPRKGDVRSMEWGLLLSAKLLRCEIGFNDVT